MKNETQPRLKITNTSKVFRIEVFPPKGKAWLYQARNEPALSHYQGSYHELRDGRKFAVFTSFHTGDGKIRLFELKEVGVCG